MAPQGGSRSDRSLRILIANRGEIALRIQSSILQLGHVPLGLYTAAEGPHAPHLRHLPASSRLLIPGHGAAAYLDIPSIIAVAQAARADAVIPGYGFLSESPAFAQAVLNAGMTWIGPRPDTLSLFGDKYESKQFAHNCGVPVLSSTRANASLDDIRAFAAKLPAGTKVLLKALEGGGGRGIRIVNDLANLQAEYDSCRREAVSAFGSDKVFAEPFLQGARHVEVQIVGDGKGGARSIGERECSLQRRNQKLIEICPSPTLVHLPKMRHEIAAAALKMAQKGKLLSLATMEFLVVAPKPGSKDAGAFFFLECNPRLQVEHTVTEEVYGVDLVATQINLALGAPLDAVVPPVPAVAPRVAIQMRINAERYQPDGSTVGTTGSLRTFLPPSGPGIRVDTAAHPPLATGTYKQGLDFDSLLAKIIVVGPDYHTAIAKARRALEQLRIAGVQTNRSLLLALTEDPNVVNNEGISTRYVEQNAGQLYERTQQLEEQWKAENEHDTHAEEEDKVVTLPPAAPGQAYIKTHLPGRIVTLSLKEGAEVSRGDEIAIVESMKMEHTVRSEVSGTVLKVYVQQGGQLADGEAIALVTESDTGVEGNTTAAAKELDLDSKSAPLLELEEVRAQMEDDHPIRAKATKRRRDRNYRTARENLADLVDTDTFLEYGDLVMAAQRTRLKPDALAATRNDGVIVGWGKVNGGRCAVVMYDYGVLAGTQGYFHHLKLDRIFNSVLENPAPVVIYAEGGGGRPGDVDLVNSKVAGLNTPSFILAARCNARGIPLVGVANGYLFAGNAALLGCADIIIATTNAGTSIGMGGPAMVIGGGIVDAIEPEDIGPVRQSHMDNGNVDVVVHDEAEATAAAKLLVGYFQPPVPEPFTPTSDAHWWTKDARLFRHAIPTDRKRAYDMHGIIALIADDGHELFELGPHWGGSLITGFIRVQGQTLGVIASNVLSPLGGAIDGDSARKAIRFINILTKTRCAHLLALCDTPGFMVGPQAEREGGGLRAFAEYFSASAALVDSGARVFGLTIRKAYGLGAQAVLGGSTLVPFHCVAWPSGEFAGMGIEGAVKLGMRKELEAIADVQERQKAEQGFVDDMYARGRAIRMAEFTEIDGVIDPAETRGWLVKCMASVVPRSGFDGLTRGGGARL